MKLNELQINTLKEKHKDIFEISVTDDEGKTHSAVFRKPDLKVISAASKYAETDPIKSSMIVFDNCWLEGDIEIKESEELKLSVVQELGKLFKVYQATVKKL